MALLFYNGFDYYATADISKVWTNASGGGSAPTISSSGGRNSTGGLVCSTGVSNDATAVFQNVGTQSGDVIVGFAIAPTNLTNVDTPEICTIFSSGSAQLTICLTGNGTLSVKRGSRSGTSLGTASAGVPKSTFSYIELRAKIHGSTGTVDLYINSSNVLSLTGQNTSATGGTTWDTVAFGLVSGSVFSWSYGATYDDVYIASSAGSAPTTVLGPVRCAATLPSGAGSSTQFTPSAGSNYQCVDDSTPNDDTDYNSDSTAGHIDLYAFTDYSVSGTVIALQTHAIVRSAAAGAETIRPKYRISSTNYSGTTVGVTTSYRDNFEIKTTSPATSSAWTISEINSAEFGIELVS